MRRVVIDVVVLPLWTELRGKVREILERDGAVGIILSDKRLAFMADSAEGQAIAAAIRSGILKPGAHVGLTMTDRPGMELLIRALDGKG